MSSPNPRRSLRNKATLLRAKEERDEESAIAPTLATNSVTESVSSSSSVSEDGEDKPKRKRISKKEDLGSTEEKSKKSPKKAKVEPQRITERDEIEKLWKERGDSYSKSQFS